MELSPVVGRLLDQKLSHLLVGNGISSRDFGIVTEVYFASRMLFSYLSTQSLYWYMSLANRSLLEGESFVSWWSWVEQASIKVWATTDRQPSTLKGTYLWIYWPGYLCRFLDVKDKVWIFNEIDPKPKRKSVRLPSMHHFRISYSVFQSLAVHEVEHILDSGRKGETMYISLMRENAFQEIIYEFLKGSLHHQQSEHWYLKIRRESVPCEIDLSDHLLLSLWRSVFRRFY